MTLALIGVVVVGLWPLFSLLPAKLVVSVSGCAFGDSYTAPCMIDGTDYRLLLLRMSTMPWFLFCTLPLGVVALIVWIIAADAPRTKHRPPPQSDTA